MRIALTAFALSWLLQVPSSGLAATGPAGSAEAWYDGRPAPAEGALAAGQNSTVELGVSTTRSAQIDVLLSSPGRTPAFTTASGPVPYGEWLHAGAQASGWEGRWTWTLQPSGQRSGEVPIEARVQFQFANGSRTQTSFLDLAVATVSLTSADAGGSSGPSSTASAQPPSRPLPVDLLPPLFPLALAALAAAVWRRT